MTQPEADQLTGSCQPQNVALVGDQFIFRNDAVDVFHVGDGKQKADGEPKKNAPILGGARIRCIFAEFLYVSRNGTLAEKMHGFLADFRQESVHFHIE